MSRPQNMKPNDIRILLLKADIKQAELARELEAKQQLIYHVIQGNIVSHRVREHIAKGWASISSASGRTRIFISAGRAKREGLRADTRGRRKPKILSLYIGGIIMIHLSRKVDSKNRIAITSTLYQTSCPPGAVVELACHQVNVFDSFQDVFLVQPDGRLCPLAPCELSAGS